MTEEEDHQKAERPREAQYEEEWKERRYVKEHPDDFNDSVGLCEFVANCKRNHRRGY
ncbi:MAG: hypothetical protein WC623_22485 [Pedobacter sp.]|uniref:hypothetical protein n=1 Tax=Pedobacter sp. TaxID=1411316 RepID=UPI003562FEE0